MKRATALDFQNVTIHFDTPDKGTQTVIEILKTFPYPSRKGLSFLSWVRWLRQVSAAGTSRHY
jgi:hypothetical protein